MFLLMMPILAGAIYFVAPAGYFERTAGSFANQGTGPDQDQTFTLTDDAHLPRPGTRIDLYAVARDDRGGADWLHRTLVVAP